MRTWVVAVVLVAGCAPPHPIERKPMGRTECREAIEGFVSGDAARLRALPAGCTLADVSAVVPPVEGEARGELGEQIRTPTLRYFTVPHFGRVRAWLDAEHIVLLDAEEPPAALDAYLHALGEPEARLDYAWEHVKLEGAELVWPARGVVVAASADVKGVIRVGIFPAMSLAEYRRTTRFVGKIDDRE
jgi:hypothetical protein